MRTKAILKHDGKRLAKGPKPSSLKIRPNGRKPLIEMNDVYDAAARLGLEPVRIEEINGYYVLGEWIDQNGAIPIGRTILLMAHQHLSGGLKHCDKLLSQELGVADTNAVLQTLQGLALAQIRCANALIGSDGRADSLRNQDSPPVMPPPARQTVVPIKAEHVTIHTDGKH